MNETQRRIKAYKEALPGLRERVVAVALLLAMSMAMMTSASFAWLTISRRPELTGVSTTVAANGNLEIALVGSEGKRPDESAVGDSSATKGQSITASNITWGNLVNLSDPAYGLENLTLRPAQLNTASLLESPLYGAVYGSDGRITQLSSNFGYATWVPPTDEKPGYFGVSDDYGVRAISSTTIQAVGAEVTYYNMTQAAKNKNLGAGNMYSALGDNDKYMPSLATMMGLYMTARMNPDEASLNNPDVAIADIQNLRDMYAAFLDCFDAEADAMAAMLNLQLFLKYGEGAYTPYTAADVYATTSAQLTAAGLKISDLDQFKKDRNIIASDLEKLKEICTSGQNLTWKDTGLNEIVNNLVNVGACTIGSDNTPISSIGASNALGYLSGTQEARITNGILYRFEERTGGYIEVKGLSISAKVKRMGMTIPATVKANIQTTAPRDYNLFGNDMTHTAGMNEGFKGGIPVAEDTYGLAVDLWVRTNAEGSYLTLEGNVLTESHWIRATGTDANGNTVELYTVQIQVETDDGKTDTLTYTVYWGTGTITDEEGNPQSVEGWLDADFHSLFTEEELGGATPIEKMEEIVTVIGFEGENRVWEGNEFLSTDATTQGSGSCYVYYADSPEDQARSLRLLEAFNVAFVDANGKLMATAIMDTERAYAVSGRVTVPLVLDPSKSVNLGEDINGVINYAITALEKNVPTRITAIVYLDGTKLSNQEVLAASDIQGQLNIQFGSSSPLNAISNETLENAIRTVSASVSNTSFDYDTATEDMKTTVTVHVDGEQPNQVTAFFLRSVNASQGSREETMTFTQQENGDWTADYIFTSPGTYILRTVRLDGVDYDLPAGNLPQIVVTGFAIEYLRCSQATENNHVSVMSAANASTVNLSMKFVTHDEDKMPRTVVGRYLRDDGSAVNVTFTLDATTQIWSGSATFLTSGHYQLQYLVLDGEYVELDSAFWQTASVTLGMRVAIYTTSPHSFKYIPSELTDNQKLLAMQVMIMDNTGKAMPGLTGAKLTYTMKGSGVKKMDTDLVWNGSYYVGELQNGGPGIWQFGSVIVSGNTMTYATQSPTFSILSPEPPVYLAHRTNSYQYSPNNTAIMDAQITNSAAASVQAYIVKAGASEGVWVTGALGQEGTTEDGKTYNHWNFPVPKDANGYQDGNWQLKELRLWDVFAADGTPYTEEAPLVFDVANTNNVAKVVARTFITFPEGMSADFGKDANGTVTGTFMQGYTVSGLYVDIKDFEGKALSGIDSVKLDFAYGDNSVTYGGYSSPDLTASAANFSITLKNDGSGTRFVQDGSVTLRYAGSYATTFSFKAGETLVSYTGDKLPANAPKYTVSSVAPTVKITAISNHNNKDSKTSSKTDTTATVYFGSADSSGCSSITNYTQPHVTITLAGYGQASGATLTFAKSGGGTVHLYTSNGGTSTVNTFTWTANGTCQRYVGYYKSKSAQTDDHTVAGTLTATELVLTYSGMTFKVDIADITINNPS